MTFSLKLSAKFCQYQNWIDSSENLSLWTEYFPNRQREWWSGGGMMCGLAVAKLQQHKCWEKVKTLEVNKINVTICVVAESFAFKLDLRGSLWQLQKSFPDLLSRYIFLSHYHDVFDSWTLQTRAANDPSEKLRKGHKGHKGWLANILKAASPLRQRPFFTHTYLSCLFRRLFSILS